MTKRLASVTLILVVIVLFSVIGTEVVGLNLPADVQLGRPYPTSDSPFLQLPAHLRNLPPRTPQLSAVPQPPEPNDPTAVDTYDLVTRAPSIIPSSDQTRRTRFGDSPPTAHQGSLPSTGGGTGSIIGADGRQRITPTIG